MKASFRPSGEIAAISSVPSDWVRRRAVPDVTSTSTISVCNRWLIPMPSCRRTDAKILVTALGDQMGDRASSSGRTRVAPFETSMSMILEDACAALEGNRFPISTDSAAAIGNGVVSEQKRRTCAEVPAEVSASHGASGHWLSEGPTVVERANATEPPSGDQLMCDKVLYSTVWYPPEGASMPPTTSDNCLVWPVLMSYTQT